MFATRHPRIYQWVKPRSLGLHLAFVVIAAGCLTAMWWQVNRAMQGNVLSYLYSVEWPAFAVVAGIGWWQMVHDTPEDLARRREFHHRMRRASAEVVARTLPRSATALTVDSEELGANRLGPVRSGLDDRALARGTRSADMGGGAGPGQAAVWSSAGGGGAGGRLDATTGTELVPAGAGWLDTDAGAAAAESGGARELAAERLLAEEDLSGDEMSEYNRYLALLAVRGKAKTWRNPRGI